MSVSILILTLNEEDNLPGCLDSVSFSDDVHVFDSFSSDQTLSIAARAGAKVTQRKFDDWSSHQNWAIKNITFKHPWVFYIDADERITPALRAEIERVAHDPHGSESAFHVQRRDFFLGRWLRHVQASPFFVRLFRPEKIRYERLSHPVTHVEGETGTLSGYLDHFPFTRGIHHWFVKHNGYSDLEAKQLVLDRTQGREFSLIKAFTAKNFTEKRYHQKELFYRLPARPFFRFMVLYVLKRGFLDGYPGYLYACLQSIYEYMIVLKTKELEQEWERLSRSTGDTK